MSNTGYRATSGSSSNPNGVASSSGSVGGGGGTSSSSMNESNLVGSAAAVAATNDAEMGTSSTSAAAAALSAASAQLSHKLRMDRYVSSSLSSAITNANIVFETKIRIIDILQVCNTLLSFSLSFSIYYLSF